MNENHGLDTDESVFFYEQEFYMLSNFSSFSIDFDGLHFPTAEHLYHWKRFESENILLAEQVRNAKSAHEAFRIAQDYKLHQRTDWNEIKVNIMRQILMAKTIQHEYVHRKLMQTGTRMLVENSWRDSFWGWGEDHKGKNMLGKLWMQVRESFREIS